LVKVTIPLWWKAFSNKDGGGHKQICWIWQKLIWFGPN